MDEPLDGHVRSDQVPVTRARVTADAASHRQPSPAIAGRRRTTNPDETGARLSPNRLNELHQPLQAFDNDGESATNVNDRLAFDRGSECPAGIESEWIATAGIGWAGIAISRKEARESDRSTCRSTMKLRKTESRDMIRNRTHRPRPSMTRDKTATARARTSLVSLAVSRLISLVALVSAIAFVHSPARADIETVYVIQMSHADVGFDAPPAEMFQRNHDRTVAALDLADQYPDFHWTIETAYQLEGFLTRAKGSDLIRLRDRLIEGRFDYCGQYTNVHSGNCGAREFDYLMEPGKRFAAQLGVSADTAMLDDVPGFSFAMPRVLQAAGMKYAVLGANDFIAGKPDIPFADRPFWWESRDGSRVLCWLTYGSYIEGHFDFGLTSLNNAYPKVTAIIDEFEQAGYPYDSILVMRGSDDEIPNSVMPELANQWNATYASPKIKLATADQFFEHLLDTYGDVFPTYTGDASGMWESVTMVTPATTAVVRKSRERLPDLEALWQVIAAGGGGGKAYPDNRFHTAWKAALIFDEHSGGGFGWPGLLTAKQVREENRQFATIARKVQTLTQKLENDALDIAAPTLVPAGETNLVLINPGDSAFEGVIEVDCPGPHPDDFRLVDPNGGPDPVFRWMNVNRTAIAIRTDIPANGWRRFQIEGGGSTPPHPTWKAGTSISIGDLELTLDQGLGTAISLTDRANSIDWLDQSSEHKFGGIEQATNLEAYFGAWRHMNPESVRFRAEDGDVSVFRRIQVFNRNDELIREYRVFEDEIRVDVQITLRRGQLPFVPWDDHSHHYSVNFPANLLPPTSLHVDGPDGWFQPGPESMPGTGLGHFGVSTGARIEDANGRWMSITSVDSPMVDLGEMNESALPEIETDENGLGWKLVRHADLSEVKGGAHKQMYPEPGFPEDVEYWFRIRFGEANHTPPDRGVLHRDIAPPLTAWVEKEGGAAAGVGDDGQRPMTKKIQIGGGIPLIGPIFGDPPGTEYVYVWGGFVPMSRVWTDLDADENPVADQTLTSAH
jgi:hypothetical protein